MTVVRTSPRPWTSRHERCGTAPPHSSPRHQCAFRSRCPPPIASARIRPARIRPPLAPVAAARLCLWALRFFFVRCFAGSVHLFSLAASLSLPLSVCTSVPPAQQPHRRSRSSTRPQGALIAGAPFHRMMNPASRRAPPLSTHAHMPHRSRPETCDCGNDLDGSARCFHAAVSRFFARRSCVDAKRHWISWACRDHGFVWQTALRASLPV